jgi:hypothetical protein
VDDDAMGVSANRQGIRSDNQANVKVQSTGNNFALAINRFAAF